jgi:hypothetical protein
MDIKSLLKELGGDTPQNRAIAEGLQKQGISSTKDIGVEKVVVPGRWEGTDEASRYVAETTENVYVNKATGKEINPTRLGIIQNGTAGVKDGDIFFHLNSDDKGNIKFDPQWSPRAHGFLRDNTIGQLIMKAGAIIPNPFQGAFIAANTIDAAAHGKWGKAALNLLPVADQYFGVTAGIKEALGFTPTGLPAPIVEANPFSDIFNSAPTELLSSPENVSGLAEAIGAETSAIVSPTITTVPTDVIGGASGGYDWAPDIAAQTSEAFGPLGDLTGGADAAEAAKVHATSEAANVNNINNDIRWNRGDFGNPNDPTNYGNEAKAYTGENALDPVTNSPINLPFTREIDLTGKSPPKSDLLKAGKELLKTAGTIGGAAAAVTYLKNNVNSTTSAIPTLDRPTYKNAPIEGFRMQKMQNAGGLTSYVPFVNDKNLLPIPDGFKPI